MENGQVFENLHHVILKYNLIIHLGCRELFSSCFAHSNEKNEKTTIHFIHSINYSANKNIDRNYINGWHLFSAQSMSGSGLKILYALTHWNIY